MSTLTAADLANHFDHVATAADGTKCYTPKAQMTYCAGCGHDIPLDEVDPDETTGEYTHGDHAA
jgi:hypothetical protein